MQNNFIKSILQALSPSKCEIVEVTPWCLAGTIFGMHIKGPGHEKNLTLFSNLANIMQDIQEAVVILA